jgi:hypothetical protein
MRYQYCLVHKRAARFQLVGPVEILLRKPEATTMDNAPRGVRSAGCQRLLQIVVDVEGGRSTPVS